MARVRASSSILKEKMISLIPISLVQNLNTVNFNMADSHNIIVDESELEDGHANLVSANTSTSVTYDDINEETYEEIVDRNNADPFLASPDGDTSPELVKNHEIKLAVSAGSRKQKCMYLTSPPQHGTTEQSQEELKHAFPLHRHICPRHFDNLVLVSLRADSSCSFHLLWDISSCITFTAAHIKFKKLMNGIARQHCRSTDVSYDLLPVDKHQRGLVLSKCIPEKPMSDWCVYSFDHYHSKQLVRQPPSVYIDETRYHHLRYFVKRVYTSLELRISKSIAHNEKRQHQPCQIDEGMLKQLMQTVMTKFNDEVTDQPCSIQLPVAFATSDIYAVNELVEDGPMCLVKGTELRMNENKSSSTATCISGEKVKTSSRIPRSKQMRIRKKVTRPVDGNSTKGQKVRSSKSRSQERDLESKQSTEAKPVYVPASSDRNAKTQVNGVLKRIKKTFLPNPREIDQTQSPVKSYVTPQEDRTQSPVKSYVTPQKEVQYGARSDLEFSKLFAWMQVLESFVMNGGDPVICLKTKDLKCSEYFSNRRVLQFHANVDRHRGSSGDTENSEMNEPFRDAAGHGDHPPPVPPAILHASEYPKVLEMLGNIDSLPRELQMPAFFVAGIACFKMSRFDESRDHFFRCESLALSERKYGDVMLCNAYLGDIEYSTRSYLKAAEHYARSIQYYKYSPGTVALIYRLTPPTLSAVYAKMASSYRSVSKMIEAVRHYNTAIEKAQNDRDRLSAHTSLGNLYQSMGDNGNALEQYKESIQLAEKLSDYISLGWAHGNIGNAYLGLNRKDEAVYHLQKSLDLAMEYERTPQAIGRTYNNLGTAYQSMSDLDKAEEFYDLALSQAIYGNDIPGQARVYGNIGNVYMLRKNYDRAVPHYSEVLTLSNDPSTTNTAQHNRGCAYYEWATSLHDKNVSQPYLHGEYDKDSCLPPKARELYSKGAEDLHEVVKYHEKRFHDIKGSKSGLTLSVSLIESNSRTFHRLQDCLVNLHRWNEALVVAEQSRARTLGELMLKRRVNDLKQPLTSPLNFDQITSIIKSQKCPVVYLSYTGARLIGWVFVWRSGKTSMNLFELPLKDDQFEGKSFDYHLRYSLTEKLVEHSFEMYQPMTYDEKSSSTVEVLYDLVGMPLTKFLCLHENAQGSQQVICISDSYTCLLPLSCLHDKADGSFFGDQYYFKLAPSLLSLGIMSQQPEVTVTLGTDQHEFCVIGDPNIPPFYLNGELWTLGKLPFARREAEWVAHALLTKPILNEHASKTALLTRAMSAKVIHIATHGSASAGFLAFATFATAAVNRSFVAVAAENVLLYPKDVEKLHISPALVVLSSCDSGRGTVKADGIQGMARAFILAGAQSVLTTLWKVPDESASIFMQFFYQYLVDGLYSSLALQKAILSIRCFAKYSQYIHWSGYQLTGRDVLFSKNESLTNVILFERLGTATLFPRFHDVKALENAFIKSPNLPTDVQVLQGCPGMKLSEVAIDFITTSHQHFPAGIFWINCGQLSLLKANISCIEEVLGCGITKIPVADTQQALFVFDSFTHLFDCESMVNILQKQHVHIIVLHDSCTSVDKFVKDVDLKLVRGCNFLNIKPLTMIHSTQRIVHSIMKEYDFTPTNDDQLVIEKLAAFTSGSPLLIDIATLVVCSLFAELKQNSVHYLTELLSKDAPLAKPSETIPNCPPLLSRTASEESIDNVGKRETSAIWATNTEYDSWDSVIALVDSCNLTTEERLLFNSLLVFNGSPIPHSILSELALVIANSCQKPHLAGTLHCKLFKYKLVCNYPHPVVVHKSVIHDSSHDRDSFRLVHIPLYVSQCMWNNCEKVDQVVVLNLAFHTLCKSHPILLSDSHMINALCSLLLEACNSNYELIGKQCYQEMYILFLRCTLSQPF